MKMEYKGKLYGTDGNTVFQLLNTTDDWDAMEKQIAELKAENEALKNAINKKHNRIRSSFDAPTGLYQVAVDVADPNTNDISCRIWMKKSITGKMVIVAEEYYE